MHAHEEESSPYVDLVNLCYQLRHEKESVSSTVAAKDEIILNLEAQLSLLKQQLVASDSSSRSQIHDLVSDKLSLESDRSSLTHHLVQLDEKVRKLETREIQAREQADQFEDMVRILKEKTELSVSSSSSVAANNDMVKMNRLESENQRLKKEISTLSFLVKQSTESRRTDSSDMSQNQVVKKRVREDESPKYTLSSSDSLLREFESIIGWSILKEEETGKIDLVCNSNTELVVRLINRDGSIEVLDDEQCPAVTFLRAFNSVPGYVAKKTLEDLARRVIRD